jgi:hypothetical protein
MAEDAMPHQIVDTDGAAAVESLVVDGSGSDGSARISVDRAAVDRRIASADLSADGLITDRIVGGAPKGEQAELRVAQYLVAHLNQLGADWQSPELVRADAHNERGVDCIARNTTGQELQIQVTTIEREVWRKRENVHERSMEIPEVVEAIRIAIQAKATRADRKIVLALDATDSLGPALRAVVEAFRTQHGAWAGSVGFQEIWLVGAVVALVNRLDKQL